MQIKTTRVWENDFHKDCLENFQFPVALTFLSCEIYIYIFMTSMKIHNNSIMSYSFAAHQRSCRKVMFSVMSVHQSVILTTEGASHVTITHDALDLTIQRHPQHGVSLHRDPWAWNLIIEVTSGGHHWRHVQTCSFEDPPVLTSGGHCSNFSRQVGDTHPIVLLSCYHPQCSCGKVMFYTCL